jgi:hypothetical protein
MESITLSREEHSVESIILTREELYEMVWRESVLSISKKYDISDVGIRKTCRRLVIPTPPNGHWQRIRYGKKSPKVKLPKFSGREEKIIWQLRTPESEKAKAADQMKIDPALQSIIPERLTNPDKLVIEARERLNHTDEWTRPGELRYSNRDNLDIRVTDKFISRALRFMDTLIKALRSRGHEVKIDDTSWRPSTYVEFEEQKVKVFLRERTKRVYKNDNGWNRSDMVPSGILFFRVEGENGREFIEGNRTLEEMFPDIIAKIELEGQKLIIREAEWAKERAIRDAEEKIRKKLEERQQKEVDELIELLGKFNRWQQTQQLREYLDELEKKTILDNKHTEDFRSWLKRAREKADWLDPMIERKDEWLDSFDREKVIARADQRE